MPCCRRLLSIGREGKERKKKKRNGQELALSWAFCMYIDKEAVETRCQVAWCSTVPRWMRAEGTSCCQNVSLLKIYGVLFSLLGRCTPNVLLLSELFVHLSILSNL